MEAELSEFVEDVDYVIEKDGSISPVPDVGVSELYVPPNWSRMKVKFNAFPNLRLKAYHCKLTTLENFPTVVKGLVINSCTSLANLAHGPKEAEEVKIVRSGVTSLTGCPKAINIAIHDCDKLMSLKGLEGHDETRVLSVDRCGIKTLDGMPKRLALFQIDECNEMTVIRFPAGVQMTGLGTLRVGPLDVTRLSPTLALVPGLQEIRWASLGHRDDILRLFNEHLNNPNRRKAYLAIQQELIERDMEWMAEQ